MNTSVVGVRKELRHLTALRWCAAMTVFFFHVQGAGIAWRPLVAFDAGQTGVTFFFVLSGFVLTWAYNDSTPRSTFYLRRFARIYPSMTVMTVVALVALVFWPNPETHLGPLGIVTALFAVQAWFPAAYPAYAINSVSWSLSAEAFFYATLPWIMRPFTALDARRRRWIVAASLLVAMTLAQVLNIGGDVDMMTAAWVNPLIRLPEFLLGVAVALEVKEGTRLRVPFLLAVVLTVFSEGVADVVQKYWNHAFSSYIVVLPVALLIASAAERDIEGREGLLTTAAANYLGRVSFCFYLVHQVVVRVFTVVTHADHRWSFVAGMEPLVVTLALSMAGAMALHHLVELPFQRWILATASRPGGPAEKRLPIAVATAGSP